MPTLNKEKALYAIQTLIAFLNIAKETQGQNASEVKLCHEKALALLEKVITNALDAQAAIFQLNGLIEQVNQMLKAPYPVFATDTSENIVKGEIVAFEHYLNQELKANHLSIQEEAPLFNDSLSLWEKVGVSLTAKEGACEFAALIEKLNNLLPKEEQYPLLDTSQYE